MKNKIAILGASGNVGRLCSQYFADKGNKIEACGRSLPEFNHLNITNFAVDYLDQDSITKIFQNSDAVLIFIAVEYKTRLWKEMWPQFAGIFQKAILASQTKCIFFDNVYPYGLVKGKMMETTPLNPVSKKGQIRKEVDDIFLELISQNKDVIIARSADFYGPNVSTSIMSQRFHDLLKTKNVFEWIGNPDKFHNFTYLPDIPPAIYELTMSKSTGVYHLPTTSQNMSGNSVKKILTEHTKIDYKTANLSSFMVKILGIFIPILRELSEMMYQFENDYNFDSSKIMTEFPSLKITPPEKGLVEQYSSYIK